MRKNGEINSTIIKVLHIPKEKSDLDNLIKTAKEYEKYCDALLVDTKIERIKIEGKTHDWKISKTIRESIKKPLILAGGLNEKNLPEVLKYNFYGVDVSSGVEKSKGKKDKMLLKNFIEIAKNGKVWKNLTT